MGYPDDKFIHELFEAQTRLNPAATAVVYEDAKLSYAELNKRANQLALFLVKEKQVKPDTLVGIYLERSLDMVVSILGVLKAGGAYVPLDPDYPEARLAFMLADSGVDTVITQHHLAARLSLPDGCAVCLDDSLVHDRLEAEYAENPIPRELGLRPTHLAYVIYTSGSTGKPKGSMLEHRGLTNLVYAQQQGFHVLASSSVLQFASCAFDAAISEVAVALCSGAQLVVVPSSAIKNVPALEATIKNKKVTHATLPPALLALLKPSAWESVHTLVIAGDTCSITVANQWSAGRNLINAYGPSEATVCATMGTFQPGQGDLHIGKPLQNIQVYILGQHGEVASDGEPGELHIGGVGLARGYLNRPDLTAEKFVANPFYDALVSGSSKRLYKTGDLACKLPDGNIKFLGRLDHQVKVRGFRIELGEIENTITTHHGVRDAIVVAKESDEGEKRLIAYVVAHHGAEDTAQESGLTASLRQHLARALPGHMMPSAFVLLAHFPLTPNGKVDRKALPEPDSSGQRQDYVAPSTELEKRLCEIWQEILHVKRVGITDNFFFLGGDSLGTIKLLAKMQDAGIDVLTRELAESSSISGIVDLLGNRKMNAGAPAKESRIYSIPNRQLLFKTAYNNHWNLDDVINIRDVDIPLLEQALQTIVARHEGLRHVFHVTDGVVGERITEPGHHPLLDVVDLSAFDSQQSRSREIERISSQVQSSFDLTGNMSRFLLFLCGGHEPARFVWIIHHALMDGYGAEVFSQQLLTLYLSLLAKLDYRLPQKTTSVAEWGSHLYHFVNSDQVNEDIKYWTSLKYEQAGTLMDYPGGLAKNRSGDAALYGRHFMVLGKLSRRHSALLREDQWKHDGVTSAGIILYSFSWAISHLTGSEHVYFELMSHGRDKIIHGVDLSRTVGWLMDNVPVFVNIAGDTDVVESVKSHARQIAAIPNFGLGFNGLKYLSTHAGTRAAFNAMPIAEFSINYVPPKISSQNDSFLDSEAPDGLPVHLLSPGTEHLGTPYRVEDKEILWPTHIQIEMKDSQHNFMWFTRDNMYRKETVESAMALWAGKIEAILEFLIA